MKIAYIAHPIGGDVANNIKKILAIVREINLNEPDVVPFAPYIPDCLIMNDSDPTERQRGIDNDHHLLNTVEIDELRLYGNRISAGMLAEIKIAESNLIPVVPMTLETKNDWFDCNLQIEMACNAPVDFICNVNDSGVCKLATSCTYQQLTSN